MSLTIDNSPFIGYAESIVDSLESCADDLTRDNAITEVAVNRLRESVIFLKQSASHETMQQAYADIVTLFVEDDEESDIMPWYKWNDICYSYKEELHLCKSHSSHKPHPHPNHSSRKLKQTAIAIKKYIQRHKKAIIIGAVVAVAVTATIIVITCSGGSAAPAVATGLSAVGGALAADNEPTKPPIHKQSNTSTPSKNSETPTQTSSSETLAENTPTSNLDSSQADYAEKNSSINTPLEKPFSLIKPEPTSPTNVVFNPMQAAMAQAKPIDDEPSKPPFQSLSNPPIDTKSTIAYHSPEPSASSPSILQNYEPTPQTYQVAKSHVEEALSYSVQAQALIVHELFSSVSNLASIPNAIHEKTERVLGSLAPLTGALTVLPQMLNTSWNEIIANGHEKIDEFFSTNQAANYPELSLGDKLIKGSLDLAMLAPELVLKTAQGAISAAKTVIGAENLAYASEALAPITNAFKPAFVLEAAEGATLKTAASQELRALKNLESLESGVISTTESAIAKEKPLEKALAKSNKILAADQASLESIEKFKNAEKLLDAYSGTYLSEAQARELIHQVGIKTFPRPRGIPETFKVKLSGKGAGMIYMHPENTHISIRVMPGKPHSVNLYQQNPYVIYRQHGKTLDKLGNIVNPSSEAAHIPYNEFYMLGS